MVDSMPSLVSRLATALVAFWHILVNPQFAAAVARLQVAESAATPGAPTSKIGEFREAEPNAALQLLGLLQQEGRFIDFIEEDVASYSDAEVGAAARVVHEGCKDTLRKHFTIEAVRNESEGTRVTLAPGFDSSTVRLTGNVVGQPPFTGGLTHKGWRVTQIRLPKVALGHDLSVVAPAEVEL